MNHAKAENISKNNDLRGKTELTSLTQLQLYGTKT
jgi:hypothetical protein